MALPLPFTITDPPAADAIQGNFEAIKQQFPLSRRNVKLETPNVIGGAGQPAFVGAWVNFDTTLYTGLRFWKDSVGMVHVVGVIKNGTINTTAFVLPPGYRPGLGVPPHAADTSTGHGRLDIAPTGNVVPVSGGTGYFAINAHFLQEN